MNRENYTVIVSAEFSASHRIPNYSGDCSNLHGHDWRVTVGVSKPTLDELGLSIDLRIVKKHLRATLKLLDHTNLNENPLFENIAPTAENIASFIYEQLDGKFDSAKIQYI